MSARACCDQGGNKETGQPIRESVSRIAHALADPRRYAILRQIAGQPGSVSFAVLCEAHAISSPTMSHHLKLLAAVKLIDVTRQGTRTTVALRSESLSQYLQDLERQLKPGSAG